MLKFFCFDFGIFWFQLEVEMVPVRSVSLNFLANGLVPNFFSIHF